MKKLLTLLALFTFALRGQAFTQEGAGECQVRGLLVELPVAVEERNEGLEVGQDSFADDHGRVLVIGRGGA